MNSIDQQQPERNHRDLTGREAQAKVKELAEKNKTCFFCTAIKTGQAVRTCPMSVQKIDERGSFWFLSPKDSHKNQDLLADPNVQLFFQASPHSDFLSLYGRARVSTDKQKIEELWEPLLRTWFTEGKDDPRISVIEFVPEHGYYWDNKHGEAVAFAKMIVGAVVGKTLDDSIQGKLRV